MIHLGGVRIWRSEWGDPTPLTLTGILAAVLCAALVRLNAVGRAGWPGNALFVDRMADPLRFHIVLATLAVLALAALAWFASTAWDLVVAWRRDSGPS